MKQLDKIMVVGADKVYAIENFYVRHIRERGITVDHFAGQSIFNDYYHSRLINKLFFRAGLSRILHTINQLFLEQIVATNPQIIWIFKGMELMSSTLKKVREMGIKLVNYNPDNPFVFTGKGSGNKNITDAIGLYDLHFTYNLQIEHMLKSRYGAFTTFLPFGFEISDSMYSACTKEKEVLKACFLGNPDKQRASFINALVKEGVSIDIYGNNWSKFVQHPAIQLFEPVYADNFWKTLRRYRVQLNLMRIHNEDSHNMRSFEVPGIGGIMVAPDTTEHRLFFEDGKNVFLYKDVTDCSALIKEILAFDPNEADSVRTNARNHSVDAGYSYKHRADFALTTLQDLYG